MDSKLIGSILLIVGTCIGAGMLALPITTSQLGFVGAVILLVCIWVIMTLSAFLILEVNLRMPQNSNLITMAGATIGPIGQIIAWITYLLLLYSLLSAYIAGGSDLFHALLTKYGLPLSPTLATILFTFILSFVVLLGIRSIDYVNRGLMVIKFGAYFLLIFLLAPLISSDKLTDGNLHYLTAISVITVTITSFGYSTIVPSLRIYFAGNVRKLKIAVIIGSLIPLLCYIAWDAVIMGVIPLHGDNSLMNIMHSDNQTSSLVKTLSDTVQTSNVSFSTRLFTSICMITSFLGVSLCLTDFLADGLSMEKVGRNNIIINVLTFLPPVLLVIFFPNLFIKALEYAGIYCVILLILLPAWMAWRGRYSHWKHKKDMSMGQAHAEQSSFQVIGGKPLLAILILLSLALLVWGFIG